MMIHLKDTSRRDQESGRRDYQPVLISEQDEKNVVLAGLMHDFGHGVYSHLFDRDLMKKVLQ
jgi:HD superfamily phosphohydrolase